MISLNFISSANYKITSLDDICIRSNTSAGYNTYNFTISDFYDFADGPLSCSHAYSTFEADYWIEVISWCDQAYAPYSYDWVPLDCYYNSFLNVDFQEVFYNAYTFIGENDSLMTGASFGDLLVFQPGSNFNCSRIKVKIYKRDSGQCPYSCSFHEVFSFNLNQNTNCADPINIYEETYSDLQIDYHGRAFSGILGSNSFTFKNGVSFVPKSFINISGFSKYPSSNATKGYLLFSNGTVIASADFSGNWANFSSSIPLDIRNLYYLAVDSDGAPYNMTYDFTFSPVYNTFITWWNNSYGGYYAGSSSQLISVVSGLSFYLRNDTNIDLLPDETIYLNPNSEFLFNWSTYEIPGYNFDEYSYNWAYLKKISPLGGDCWPNYETLISYPNNETFTDKNTYSYNPGVTCYFGYDRSISPDVIKITTGEYDTTFSLRAVYCSAIGEGYGCDDKIITFIVTGGLQQTGVITLSDLFPKPSDTSTYKWLGFIIIGCFIFFGIMLVCVPLRWNGFSLIILFVLFLIGSFVTALNGFVSWAWVTIPLALAVVYFTFKILGGFN